MRIGVIQSCYLPWRGYFDFIASVDKFVIYDDVQYSTGSWRNRNKIKMREGVRWITIPVQTHLGATVDAIRIGRPRKPWREEHRRLLREALEPAPHFGDAMRIWEDGVGPETELLSELNVRLLRLVCEYLGVTTPIVMSRDLSLRGTKTDRLLDLMKKIGGTTYLSGPAAKDYIDESLFREAGIGLQYKSYDYAPYPQLWGAFEDAVTILDLIANCGASSRSLIRSRTPDAVAITI